MTVKLTWAEVLQASHVAIMRRVQNMKFGRTDKYGLKKEDGWSVDIEGACAEKAVAKLLNVYWCGNLGDLAAADVGDLEVRATTHRNGCLILHPSDRDERRFILVVGAAPAFEVVGWILARDGKQPRFWADPQKSGRWAFFVPQSELRPMTELSFAKPPAAIAAKEIIQ